MLNQKVVMTSLCTLLACCFLAIGFLYVCFYPTATTDNTTLTLEVPSTSPAQNRSLEEAVLANTPPEKHTIVVENKTNDYDSDFYLGNTVFVGDSRTHGFLSYQYLPPEQVYSMDGSTQKNIQGKKIADLGDGILRTVDEAIGIRKPQRILIAFGINAIATMSESEFMTQYRSLVDSFTEASPESAIIIQSILPVSDRFAAQIPALDNEIIDHYNALLFQYASQNGYYYMNTTELMKDEEGALLPQYDAGDGLHFTPTAYNDLLEYYKSHMILTEASVRTSSSTWNQQNLPSGIIGDSFQNGDPYPIGASSPKQPPAVLPSTDAPPTEPAFAPGNSVLGDSATQKPTGNEPIAEDSSIGDSQKNSPNSSATNGQAIGNSALSKDSPVQDSPAMVGQSQTGEIVLPEQNQPRLPGDGELDSVNQPGTSQQQSQ